MTKTFHTLFIIVLATLASAVSQALFAQTSADSVSAQGLITVNAASLRHSPSHASELETQVLLGTPVEILGSDDGWLRVRVPDGYEAYAHPSHVALKTEAEMTAWRSAPRLILTAVAPQTIIADTLAFGPRNAVAPATLCCIFEGTKQPGALYAEVRLPDGRSGFLPAALLEPFDLWALKDATPERILSTAYSLLGTPYLWGGVSPAGVDCSGLTQLSYLSAGLLLPRNASAQALVGEPITLPDAAADLLPADLIFFTGTDSPRITHVALYDRDQTFIHSLGTVHINSLSPSSPLHLPRNAVSATRPLSLPALRLSRSPRYFNQQ